MKALGDRVKEKISSDCNFVGEKNKNTKYKQFSGDNILRVWKLW